MARADKDNDKNDELSQRERISLVLRGSSGAPGGKYEEKKKTFFGPKPSDADGGDHDEPLDLC